jgi:copper chaperone CopZ
MIRFVAVFLGAAMLVGCAKPAAESSNSSADATPVAFNVSGAPTVEFSVPDMMCPESCAVQTKEILSEQPGAKEVVVDFDSKTATVAIEEGKFDSEAAVAALVDHGFEHSSLKPAAHDAEPSSEAKKQPAG